jgi:hypothetical protein
MKHNATRHQSTPMNLMQKHTQNKVVIKEKVKDNWWDALGLAFS